MTKQQIIKIMTAVRNDAPLYTFWKNVYRCNQQKRIMSHAQYRKWVKASIIRSFESKRR